MELKFNSVVVFANEPFSIQPQFDCENIKTYSLLLNAFGIFFLW